jgi:proprotein convertase subtilisin/kexin type 5
MNGFKLFTLPDGTRKCGRETPCSGGTVEDNLLNCKPCTDTNCEVCSLANLDKCDKCKKDYNLFEKSCVKDCPVGYYSSNGNCLPCSDNCKNCTASECIECKDQYYFLDKKCVDCSMARYVKEGKYCKPCSVDGCLSCVLGNSTQCDVCTSPKVLFNGKCLDECLSRFYKSGTSCLPCNEKCFNCTDINRCTSCPSGKFLHNEDCVSPCPIGYIPGSNGKCLRCADDSCLVCKENKLEECVTCKNGTYLSASGQCVRICEDGTYPMNGYCNKCSSNCKVCESDKSCRMVIALKIAQTVIIITI